MANYERKSSGLWVWIVVGLIVATLAVAALLYIGWFDKNTHVDTPAGDNVEQTYQLTGPGADTPGEADWQNAGGQSFVDAVTKPEAEAATPVSAETTQE